MHQPQASEQCSGLPAYLLCLAGYPDGQHQQLLQSLQQACSTRCRAALKQEGQVVHELGSEAGRQAACLCQRRKRFSWGSLGTTCCAPSWLAARVARCCGGSSSSSSRHQGYSHHLPVGHAQLRRA